MKNTPNNRTFIYAGLYVFAGLGCDILVSMLIYGLIPDLEARKFIANTLTVLIWFATLFLSYRFIKKENLQLALLTKSAYITLPLISIIIVFLNIYIKDQGIPQIVREWTIFQSLGFWFIPTYIMQLIYYILEAGLITCMVIFAQKWGETNFHNKFIPYGGIFVAFTWGLIHILTQNLWVGIYGFGISLLLGFAYTLSKKSWPVLYLLALLLFII